MRMALVEVIGYLIREIALSADLNMDEKHTKKQLNGLYELLLERTSDLSSYVRTKVLTTLAKLCDLPVKFPKQRLAITQYAVECLEDKSASVRKSAVSLIVKLIVTHPYGLMHGGLLGLQEWEKRYDDVLQELDKLKQKVEKAVQRVEGQSADGGLAGGTGGIENDEDENEEDEDDDEENEEEEGPPRRTKKKQ